MTPEETSTVLEGDSLSFEGRAVKAYRTLWEDVAEAEVRVSSPAVAFDTWVGVVAATAEDGGLTGAGSVWC